MKVVASTFAFAHDSELVHMVESLDPLEHDLTVYIHVHTRKPLVVDACHYLARRPNVRLFEWGENRGLAKSFNDTLLTAAAEGADYVINSNDDSLWSAGDLGRMVNYATEHPEYYAIQATGQHSTQGRVKHAYSAVLFRLDRILDGLGMFDEHFTPAYFEDCDYDHRARLLGWQMGTCEATNVYHHGSASLEHDPDFRKGHDAQFIANRDYYIRKWGGTPGFEIFPTPFNVAWLTQYIGPETRHTPYQQIMEATHE